MSAALENNKRIAKNTFFMYARMLILMGVSLFTVRVVFNVLGTNDYGTYNIVAGIIVFFTFLNSGLSSATKRYITAEIANGTTESCKHVFNTCVVAHFIVAGIIFLLAEVIGVWTVNDILNIPSDRIYAANWVFQMSVFSALLGIMQSPFEAAIVAYEKMNIYAYFSIVDVILKLLIVYLLIVLPGDKLIVYSCLLLGVSFITVFINRIYCYRSFLICRWYYKKDVPLLKDVFKFMSWSLLGQAAVVGTNQGVSVLINVYFNVAVNAAMGISNQIVNIANRFVTNFQVAFNPQIIKSYANKEYDYLLTLIFRASKISSFLIIVFLVPLIFEAPKLLTFWLGNYPEYTIEFCIFTFIAIYIEAIGAPLWMLVYSQTNIRQYQVVLSSVYMMNFFLGWISLSMHQPPYVVIIIRIFIFVVLLGIRLYYASLLLHLLNKKRWIWQILIKGIVIIMISCVITGVLSKVVVLPNLFHVLVISILSLCYTLPLCFCLGLDADERLFCINIFKNKILHKTN